LNCPEPLARSIEWSRAFGRVLVCLLYNSKIHGEPFGYQCFSLKAALPHATIGMVSHVALYLAAGLCERCCGNTVRIWWRLSMVVQAYALLAGVV
jgi:hypothetical protein